MKFQTVLLLFLCGTCIAGEPVLWRLGEKDRKAQEFQLRYFPWEYGRAPYLRTNPHKKGFCFEYRVGGSETRPEMIDTITHRDNAAFMPKEEIVTTLRLIWEEREPGRRRFLLNLAGERNIGDRRNGIRIVLPDQRVQYADFPASKEQYENFLNLVFPVKTGTNQLELKVISHGKYARISFDSMELRQTDAETNLKPWLRADFREADHVFTPGDAVTLELHRFLPSGQMERCSWKVTDFFGKTVAQGEEEFRSERLRLRLPSDRHGWFRVECSTPSTQVQTAYTVLEPVQLEYDESSRFGLHHLGDSYIDNFDAPAAEKIVRRAWRAGAKHMRYHYLKWNLRRPDRNQPYSWKNADRRLELMERYRLIPLINIVGTPKWASPDSSEALTPPIGVRRYSMFAPEEQAWRQFVTDLVSRWKGRVKYWEIWNEPSYVSCFWLDGSPATYGRTLKAAYEAAKAADPECIILSGGLFPAALGFLEEAIRSSGGCYFDVMGIHYPREASYGQWRQILSRYRAGIPLFNTEESRWYGGDPVKNAASLIKQHVQEAVNGVERTYSFLFARPRHTGRTGAFYDAFDAPEPMYAAYRTMTHRMDHIIFLADLSEGTGKMYLFERDGEPLIVAWDDKGSKLPAALAAGAEIYDLMDNRISQPSGPVRLTENPLFLVGGDLTRLKQYAALRAKLPSMLRVRPGESVERLLPSAPECTTLPEGWKAHFQNGRWQLDIPQGTLEGVYTLPLRFDGGKISMNLRLEVTTREPGENLIRNGNFANGFAYWFRAKNADLELVKQESGNALLCQGNGRLHFGPTGKIKVQPGENYLVAVGLKGGTGFGVMYSLFDENNRRIFPAKPGINLLSVKPGVNRELYSEEIVIRHPEAAYLKFSLLPEVRPDLPMTVDQVALYRLDSVYTADRVLWQGECRRTTPGCVVVDGNAQEWNSVPAMVLNSARRVDRPAQWKGPQDLSGSARMMMDDKNLYLFFSVRDDHFTQRTPERAWEGDSIQFSFDPLLTAENHHEFLLVRQSDGKTVLHKLHNYWTPELLTGQIRQGIVPDAEAVSRSAGNGMEYELRIPLLHLFPLTGKERAFGFSFLLNDNDGAGRKYMEWSSGIGDKKESGKFGIVRVIP